MKILITEPSGRAQREFVCLNSLGVREVVSGSGRANSRLQQALTRLFREAAWRLEDLEPSRYSFLVDVLVVVLVVLVVVLVAALVVVLAIVFIIVGLVVVLVVVLVIVLFVALVAVLAVVRTLAA